MLSPRSSRLLLCSRLPFGPVHDRAVAQAPAYEVHPDYLLKRWKIEDGLPVNHINDLLQSHDGYLWMTTFDGLVRFDGEHFTVFNTS